MSRIVSLFVKHANQISRFGTRLAHKSAAEILSNKITVHHFHNRRELGIFNNYYKYDTLAIHIERSGRLLHFNFVPNNRLGKIYHNDSYLKLATLQDKLSDSVENTTSFYSMNSIDIEKAFNDCVIRKELDIDYVIGRWCPAIGVSPILRAKPKNDIDFILKLLFQTGLMRLLDRVEDRHCDFRELMRIAVNNDFKLTIETLVAQQYFDNAQHIFNQHASKYTLTNNERPTLSTLISGGRARMETRNTVHTTPLSLEEHKDVEGKYEQIEKDRRFFIK